METILDFVYPIACLLETEMTPEEVLMKYLEMMKDIIC